MMMNNVYVVAKVLAVRNLYAYPCCSVCRRKVRRLDEGDRFGCLLCKNTYKSSSLQYRYHVKLMVADSSGTAVVTVFGKSLQAFFGLTATDFSRYVSECESKEFLQGINIGEIIHLSMEKCFLGSMVRLVFQLSTPCRKMSHTSSRSPLALYNLVSPNRTSRMPCFYNTKYYNSKSPELLARRILKIECGNRKMRNIVDIFTEYINLYEEETLVTNKKVICVNEHTAAGFFKNTCLSQNHVSLDESQSSWESVVGASLVHLRCHSGNDLILSMTSVDNECRNNDVITNAFSVENQALEDHTILADQNKYSVEENSLNFTRTLGLGDLQQTFVSVSNSDVPKMWTSITEIDCNKEESSCSSISDGISNKNPSKNTAQSKCSETKQCSCHPIENTTMPFDESEQGSSKHPVPDLHGHSSEKSKGNAEDCDEPTCTHSHIYSNGLNSNFELHSGLDSPSSGDVDAFLCHFGSPCSAANSDQVDDHEPTCLPHKNDCVCLEDRETNESSNDCGSVKRKTPDQSVSHHEFNYDKRHCLNSISRQAEPKSFDVNRDVDSCEYIGTPELFSPEMPIHCRQDYQPCLSSTPIWQFVGNSRSPLIKDPFTVSGRKNTKLLQCSPLTSQGAANVNGSSSKFIKRPFLERLTSHKQNDINNCLSPVTSQLTSHEFNCGKDSKGPNLDQNNSDVNNIESENSDIIYNIGKSSTYICSPLLFSQP